MKFSVMTDTLGCDSFEDALRQAKQLGFKHVDIRNKLNGYNVNTLPMEEARKMKQQLDACGLTATCITSSAVNPCFSGAATYDNYDDRHHEAMGDILERLFDLADIFGTASVRVYPLLRKEGFDRLPDREKEREYEHNASVMLRHARHAARRNKTLLCENEPPTLAHNARELGKLAKLVNHPNFKINWDIMNGWKAGEYPNLAAYEHLKGHVMQTHLKGARKLAGSEDAEHPNGVLDKFTIADQDGFDHTTLLKAIAEHDPQAVMTIDTHYHDFDPADRIGEAEVVRRTKAYFEAILGPAADEATGGR